MTLVVAVVVGVVVAAAHGRIRRLRLPVAAGLTGAIGAAAVAALLLLDVDTMPGGNVAGGLIALTGISLVSVLRRSWSASRRPARATGGPAPRD